MKKQQRLLGEHLKASRQAKKLSLRKVEQETGISNSYLSQLESGKIRNPSPNVLYKLSTKLKVPYSDLMNLAGYPVPDASPSVASGFSSRIGPVTQEEEEELLKYLAFLRSRR